MPSITRGLVLGDGHRDMLLDPAATIRRRRRAHAAIPSDFNGDGHVGPGDRRPGRDDRRHEAQRRRGARDLGIGVRPDRPRATSCGTRTRRASRA